MFVLNVYTHGSNLIPLMLERYFFQKNEYILKIYMMTWALVLLRRHIYVDLLVKLFLYKYFKCVVFKRVYLFS